MKMILLAVLLWPSAARAAAPVKACVKWSREIPRAEAAGAGLFSSVARVEGKGPFTDCGVVVETESFGVGWLMRAWMKEGVYSSCGERLGGFKINYKGDEWQEKAILGLHEFLVKNPGALPAAKPCVIPAPAVPAPASVPATPVAMPASPVMPVQAVVPSTAAAAADKPDSISQPAIAPVHSSTETAR